MPEPSAPTSALQPCPHCGLPVVTGQLASLALVTVEPSTQVYTLTWDRGAQWPRLVQSRGYVAHTCPGG